MTDTPQVLLAHHLKALKLPTFLREYDKIARQCAAEGVDHVRYLLRLAELELIDRERRMVERRIKAARFPVVKSLDAFDFKVIPSLNKALVLELARCAYIERRENLIALGNSGTGKTHIALGLGLADRRDVELPAVRLQREGQREPVRVRGFERRRERDRPLVQPERPCPVELDAPALGTELGDPSRDEADAGRGRGVVPVTERREDDIRLAQFARQGVVVTQQGRGPRSDGASPLPAAPPRTPPRARDRAG